jgi:hypothetical protein
MNFGREFAKAFFEPDPKRIVRSVHHLGTVTALAFGLSGHSGAAPLEAVQCGKSQENVIGARARQNVGPP